MDDLTAARVYDIADRIREIADELDGGWEQEVDKETKDAVLDLLSLCNGYVPDDPRWNKALYRVLKVLGQNPVQP